MHSISKMYALVFAMMILPICGLRRADAGGPAKSGRVLRVVPAVSDSVPDDAFSSLSSALAAASPGDAIEIAPGEYVENVVVPCPDLTIHAAAGGTPQTPSVSIRAANASPTLVDAHNTFWRGVSFKAEDGGCAAWVEGFTGVFERCAFRGGGDQSFVVRIRGGAPIFRAAYFGERVGRNMGGVAEIGDSDRGGESGRVDFQYCLFREYDAGVAFVGGSGDVRFANCVFSDNGVLFTRPKGAASEILLVNCVLYFNRFGRIVAGPADAPPVRLVNCVYTPSLDVRLWREGTLPGDEAGVALENSRCLSPRFAGPGKKTPVGLGVDDAHNIDVWDRVSRMADEYGFGVTFAVNTSGAGPEDWNTMRAGMERGHEIASHSSSHAPLEIVPPLTVRADMPARLGIDADGMLSILIEEGETLAISLRDGDPAIADIAARLRKAGITAEAAPLYASVPAGLLRPAGETALDVPEPVGLALDGNAFLEHELRGSLAVLRRELPTMRSPAFVCPYGVTSPAIRKAISEAGYGTARSLAGGGEIDRFALPGYALSDAKALVPGGSPAENVRLLLEYAALRSSPLVLFSHGEDEFGLDEWRELLEALAADPEVAVVSLSEMAARFLRDAAAFPWKADAFRPAAGSPLIGAGVNLGLEADYAGTPIPPGIQPNIGLFQ